MMTVGLRCHVPSRAGLDAYQSLVRSCGAGNVWIVADEVTAAPAAWSTGNVARVTRGLLARNGLRGDLPESGWRCGDYAHLALFEASLAPRCWLVEPDVAFSRIDAKEFMHRFEDSVARWKAHPVA